MKEVFTQMHRFSKTVLITGWITVIVMLAVSTILYIGAGDLFDYYSAVEISEKLLGFVRPVCITVSIGSVALEYYIRQKDNHI